jgi:hypothetical protein
MSFGLPANSRRRTLFAHLRRPRRAVRAERDRASPPELEQMGEKAQRKGFQAEGQAGIGGGLSAAVLRSEAEGKRGGEPEQRPPLS